MRRREWLQVAGGQALSGAARAAFDGRAGRTIGTALALQAARARAAPPAGADVPLHRLHTGDLGALAAVDATLGGQPWRCLIDSGASVALVSPGTAARLGLRVVARSRVATAGGTMTLERVAMPPLRIGGERIDAGEALVLDLAAALGDAAASIDGLVGAPALRGRTTRLDLAAGRLGWDAAPATASAPAADGATWPLRWDQGLPVVDLALGDRPPAPFLFDTGNAGALVVFARHAAVLATDRDALPRTTMHELGGPVTVHQALLETLAAPGFVAHDVPVVFESGRGARRGAHFDRLAGSLGLALFGAGAVTLDGPGERLTIELPGLPAPPPLPGGYGFALRSVAGEAPAVSAVFDGGPAARAGVRPGQRLQSLDARALAGVSAGEVWRTLAGVHEARFGFDALGAPVRLARERFFVRWR